MEEGIRNGTPVFLWLTRVEKDDTLTLQEKCDGYKPYEKKGYWGFRLKEGQGWNI